MTNSTSVPNGVVAQQSGSYLYNAILSVNTGSDWFDVALYVNGTFVCSTVSAVSGASHIALPLSGVVYLRAGDYVQFYGNCLSACTTDGARSFAYVVKL